MIIYEGFFILDNLQSTLEKDITNKHITTEFRPKQTHGNLYGQEATFKIIGYGNNEINEGFLVQLVSCNNEELRQLFNKIAVPHITLSISNSGRAVDTANLDFESFNGPIIKSKFGGFNGNVIF